MLEFKSAGIGQVPWGDIAPEAQRNGKCNAQNSAVVIQRVNVIIAALNLNQRDKSK